MVSRSRKEVVTKETVVEHWSECDRCGARISDSVYDHFECSEGNSYPSGEADGKKLDLCKNCRADFWALLVANGFKPHKYSF